MSITHENFTSKAEKDTFAEKLKAVRLTRPGGSDTLNNYRLLVASYDQVGDNPISSEQSEMVEIFYTLLRNQQNSV